MGRSHAQGVWTVASGDSACELSPDGMCVSDGDGDYSNGERCTVRAEVAIIVRRLGFGPYAGFSPRCFASHPSWRNLTMYAGEGCPLASLHFSAIGLVAHEALAPVAAMAPHVAFFPPFSHSSWYACSSHRCSSSGLRCRMCRT
jgi:hypothetical protein